MRLHTKVVFVQLLHFVSREDEHPVTLIFLVSLEKEKEKLCLLLNLLC